MNTPSIRPVSGSFGLAALTLTVALFAAPVAAQPYTLPTSVVSSGGTDAAGAGFTLDGTVGQPAAGFTSNATYTLGAGFWYQAPALAAVPRSAFAEALAPLALTLTSSALSVAADGALTPITATFAVGPDGPPSFAYWTEITLPDGTVHGPIIGPSTALVTAGTTAALAFGQAVSPSAAPGAYTYTMHVGTYPDAVLASCAVVLTVPASPPVGVAQNGKTLSEPVASLSQSVTPPHPRGRRDDRARADAGVPTTAARRGAPAAVSGTVAARAMASGADDPWPAYDGEGRLLVPGTVTDLRAALAAEARAEDAAEGDAEANDPEDASSADVPASGFEGASLPSEVALDPAFPNPSVARATLRFALPAAQPVRLAVYDVLGREVAVLVDEDRPAGSHTATFDGSSLPAGAYLVRLEAEGAVLTRTLTLVR